MSCVLRILGNDLDVDRLVDIIGIPGFRKTYKGYPKSPSSDRKWEFSSASIVISEADFSEIKIQIEEAESFLVRNKKSLKNILTIREIEYATIDFGADDFIENGMAKSFYFPTTLLHICAELKLALELSVYAD